MIMKWTGRMLGITLLLSVGGAAVLGPTFLHLVKSWQAKARETANEYVDPAVRLESTVQDTLKILPQEISRLKTARAGCNEEVAAQNKAIADLKEGMRLVEGDLKVLATASQRGEGCQIRGKQYSVAEATEEGGRLLAKLKQYDSDIQGRSLLLAKVQKQARDLDAAITAAEHAARDFSARSQEAVAKVELLRAGERVQAIRESAKGFTAADSTASLEGLNKDLDRRLQEQEERARMTDNMAAGDPYLDQARQTSVVEDLKRYAVTEPASRQEAP